MAMDDSARFATAVELPPETVLLSDELHEDGFEVDGSASDRRGSVTSRSMSLSGELAESQQLLGNQQLASIHSSTNVASGATLFTASGASVVPGPALRRQSISPAHSVDSRLMASGVGLPAAVDADGLDALVQFVNEHITMLRVRFLSSIRLYVPDGDVERCQDAADFVKDACENGLLHATAQRKEAKTVSIDFPEDSKALAAARDAIAAAFRFGYEELALHVAASEKPAFSHREYHAALQESVASSIDVTIAATEFQRRYHKSQEQLHAAERLIEERRERHKQTIHEYIQETNVLRDRLHDAQLKYERAMNPDVRSPTLAPGPRLIQQQEFGAGDVAAADAAAATAEGERHNASMLQLANEELILLRHTVKQRDTHVKQLQAELRTAHEEHSKLKQDAQRVMAEQAAMDADVEKLIQKKDREVAAAKDLQSSLTAQLEELTEDFDEAQATITELRGTIDRQQLSLADARRKSSVARSAFSDTGRFSNSTDHAPSLQIRPDESVSVSSPWKEQPAAGAGGDDDSESVADDAMSATSRPSSAAGARKAGGALTPGAASQRERPASSSSLAQSKKVAETLRREVEHLNTELMARDSAVRSAEAAADELRSTLATLRKQADQSELELTALQSRCERTDTEHKEALAKLAREKTEAVARARDKAEREFLNKQGPSVKESSLLADVAVMNAQCDVLEEYLQRRLGPTVTGEIRDVVNNLELQLPLEQRNVVVTKRLQAHGFVPQAANDMLRRSVDSNSALALAAPLLIRGMIDEEDDPVASTSRRPSVTPRSRSMSLEAVLQQQPAAGSGYNIDQDNVAMAREDAEGQVVFLTAELARLQKAADALQKQCDDAVARAEEAEARTIGSGAASLDHSATVVSAVRTLKQMREQSLSRPQSGLFSRQSTRASSPVMVPAPSSVDPLSDDPLNYTSEGPAATQTQLAADFPGLEYATEYYDVVEASQRQRNELRNLVRLCAAAATRRALEGDDAHAQRAMLRDRFVALRSVDAEAQLLLRRLKATKEDIMRNREEDLELVLGSVQNIASTHPREVAELMHAARHKTIDWRAVSGDTAAGAVRVQAVVERPGSSMGLSPVPQPVPDMHSLSLASPSASRVARSATPGTKDRRGVSSLQRPGSAAPAAGVVAGHAARMQTRPGRR